MKIDWGKFQEQLLKDIGDAIDEESLTYAISLVATDVVTIALERYHELLHSGDTEGNSLS
jgi:thiazole synthase ThiGH ThiG subunit